MVATEAGYCRRDSARGGTALAAAVKVDTLAIAISTTTW